MTSFQLILKKITAFQTTFLYYSSGFAIQAIKVVWVGICIVTSTLLSHHPASLPFEQQRFGAIARICPSCSLDALGYLLIQSGARTYSWDASQIPGGGG
jgi:hypothetical protein